MFRAGNSLVMLNRVIEPGRIPAYGWALLDALRFANPNFDRLRSLSQPEWLRLLEFCDRAQLTLLLGHVCQEHLPARVLARVSRDRANYSRRFAALQSRVLEIAAAFQAASIPFVLLKGFAQAELFAPDPLLRAQGDIDLWCLSESLDPARQALNALGYRPVGVSRGRHLPPMIRETHWKWNGDHFAADLPIPIDLHYRLWDPDMERFPGPDELRLWKRRGFVLVYGRDLPVLDPADALIFSAFHLLMHLLHGDLRLQRGWELAYFLENHVSDDEFWKRWERLYAPAILRTQIILFLLVHLWFKCKLPPRVAERARELPDNIALWVHRFGFSPVANLFTPNKDELWLNLCLLGSRRDKLRVASRRLFPLSAAGLSMRVVRPGGSPVRKRLSALAFVIRRAVHHTCILLLTFWKGIRWLG